VGSVDVPLVRIDRYRWEIPQSYKPGMRVPGLVYADEHLLSLIREEQALEQVANVAFLPGIVGRSLAMPDIHWGYGFPVGGVAATRVEDGVVSPGGIGFDINCGTRLLRTDLEVDDLEPRLEKLGESLFRNIPSGVGVSGRLRLDEAELQRVLQLGARWAVERGYGTKEDLDLAEANGCLQGADPAAVSEKAKDRGRPQLGTLGSGNHFLEVQAVERIYEPAVAAVMGLEQPGQVVVFIHTGSRGLGHQVCQDFLGTMDRVTKRHGFNLPDRQLACAPITSVEGQSYLAAMAAAANFAWANRQCITHWVRESFQQVFGLPRLGEGLRLIYDVAHNIAKIEEHEVDGKRLRVCVHRKGATRAFSPGHPEVPARYQGTGQPVLIPGDMGRYSYVAVGCQRAMEETFGSTCHGAGRVQSRSAAKRNLRGVDIAGELASRGILVKAHSPHLLAEEASEAYKDVAEVMEVVDKAGLCRTVARLKPLLVVKG